MNDKEKLKFINDFRKLINQSRNRNKKQRFHRASEFEQIILGIPKDSEVKTDLSKSDEKRAELRRKIHMEHLNGNDDLDKAYMLGWDEAFDLMKENAEERERMRRWKRTKRYKKIMEKIRKEKKKEINEERNKTAPFEVEITPKEEEEE